MIEIQDGNSLAKVESAGLSKRECTITVGQLAQALVARFPREDAEEWDRMGLLVGDPSEKVTAVACALDPTLAAVMAAKRKGANVLLTHHPLFLEPPEVLSPARALANPAGVTAFEACRQGVALINLHTALDASEEATQLFARLLNLDFAGLLEPLPNRPTKGYGQLCSIRETDEPFTVARLAARCTAVFGRMPRMWGDAAAPVHDIVVANGSASGVIGACVSGGVDCLVCGEVRYHDALDASQAGLAILEVGHDASEAPLVALLASAAMDAGVPDSMVGIIDQSGNWTYPEATRI